MCVAACYNIACYMYNVLLFCGHVSLVIVTLLCIIVDMLADNCNTPHVILVFQYLRQFHDAIMMMSYTCTSRNSSHHSPTLPLPLYPSPTYHSLPSLQVGKGKGKEEDTLTSHHGVAYLDLSPLLYPGTTLMAGAYSLHPFSEADVVSKVHVHV